MQTDKDSGAFRFKLDGLCTSDVAPGWDKGAAWQKLAAVQMQHRKKTVHIRAASVATLAATLAGLCLLLWTPQRPAQVESLAFMIAKTAAALRSQTVAPAHKQEATKSPAIRPQHVAIHWKAEKAPPTVILPHAQLHEKEPMQNGQPLTNEQAIKAPGPALPETPKPLPPRPQQVVYTLNEIMTDLPAREAPPKRYSGIFHQKVPAAAVPERGTAWRRPAAMPMDESPAYPHLTN